MCFNLCEWLCFAIYLVQVMHLRTTASNFIPFNTFWWDVLYHWKLKNTGVAITWEEPVMDLSIGCFTKTTIEKTTREALFIFLRFSAWGGFLVCIRQWQTTYLICLVLYYLIVVINSNINFPILKCRCTCILFCITCVCAHLYISYSYSGAIFALVFPVFVISASKAPSLDAIQWLVCCSQHLC